MRPLPELLAIFQRDIQNRVAAEELLKQTQTGPDARELQLRSQLFDRIDERDRNVEAVRNEYAAKVNETSAFYDSNLTQAAADHQQTLEDLQFSVERARKNIEEQRHDSTWVVTSVLDDSADDSPARIFERFKFMLNKSREDQVSEWEKLDAEITAVATARGYTVESPAEFDEPPQDREAAATRFDQSLAQVRAQLRKLNGLLLPQLVSGWRAPVLFLVLTAVAAGVFYSVARPEVFGVPANDGSFTWLLISSAAGAIFALLLTLVLFTLASMKQSDLFRQIMELRGEVYWAHQHWLRFAKEQLARQQREFEIQQKRVARDRKGALSRFESAHEKMLQEIQQDFEDKTRIENRRYAEEHAQLSAGKREQLAALERDFRQTEAQLQSLYTTRIDELQKELDEYQARRLQLQQDQWVELKTGWERGIRLFETELKSRHQEQSRNFLPWTELSQGNWAPAEKIPASIRLGECLIDLNAWEGAVSPDPRLAPRNTLHRIPLAPAFPSAASVLFKSTKPEARATAIGGLQCLMLRLLTLLPPGKLRFTIIDPVGLGESFGGFMHLADYDELLVTSRIWTEGNQIEARLADLTEHMENVLQKYLRNEFQTIEEYNESAGEVAEPYHVLVISDFPAKFSEIAARRLVSIVNSGPRCGVYTLMNCDPGKTLPHNFQLSDIQSNMFRLEWESGAFRAPDSPLAQWPIVVDRPPPPDEFTSIVKMVGDASKDSRRVEVSFGRITPSAEQIWTGDSRSELVVPLGRAGATKLQQLKLGKGTSQHMLVAGKTGSGKSTFLHILITNLALHYSPDEVNFFLIDFKKGVEFKDYATWQMPHARVIAVESDREFGVSALARLGEILQERGELFRREGVQDIAGYRNSTGKPLPRILLVIDEFQEFFVEDDKISQSASLHLDRLVRQGRAFGIHVILGSQTLGGAYSLARSTLGQVAIRVALQCSEADAHLILSEENSAARLLTRPGEAIYNDANGLSEGNHPFQIAWISDSEREAALQEFQRRLPQTSIRVEPTIVFEGNIPSDMTMNTAVAELIRSYSTREQPVSTPTIWLGDSVEIAPATSLTFHRQSGANLLLVGQEADSALGIMAAALTTLAASSSPAEEVNSLFVLDGSHSGTAEAQAWEAVLNALPVNGRLIGPQEAISFLQAMTAELQRRENENDTSAPPLFLLVYNLSRFRDLRKPDDDFSLGGFGSSAEKAPAPGKQFADLLSRGPTVGIHALIWCDSLNNVERWFSRQTLRELEYRIAFQMNSSDSSNLIDSPAASRLGTHRALLHREETGLSEKFRPYGLPGEDWLRWVRQTLLGEISIPFTLSIPQKPAEEPEPEIPDLEEFSIL